VPIQCQPQCCCPGDDTISTTDCGVCADGIISQYYRVDITGVTTGTGLCTGGRTCPDLNGSYVFGPIEGDSTFCGALLEIAGVCRTDDSCFANAVLRFWIPPSGDLAGHRIVEVELSSTGDCDEDTGEPVMTFVHDFGLASSNDPPDCIGAPFPLLISGGDIEFIISPKCAAGSATCTITPIAPP